MTGCRRGEVLALTWSDVDTVNRNLIISKSLEQTKAGGLRVKEYKNFDRSERFFVVCSGGGSGRSRM
jgi:integrase